MKKRITIHVNYETYGFPGVSNKFLLHNAARVSKFEAVPNKKTQKVCDLGYKASISFLTNLIATSSLVLTF